MEKETLRKAILDRIALPEIPEVKVSAPEAGIVPDSDALQTEALQQAMDALSQKGGGRLILPAGTYHTGALRMRSHVALHLEKGARLCFTPEAPEKNYPVVYSHWEASPCMNYSALLYACDAEDIAVTGEGVLDGGATMETWWRWHHQVENAWSEDLPDLQQPDRKALRKMNMDGVPPEQRVFGPGHYLRPNFVQFLRCKRVLLQGVTFTRSPMWQLNPVCCSSVTVDGVTLQSHGMNNDGCDPESCDGVWIKHCRFDTGDDCISLKSGRDRDGKTANIPCQNVLIEHNDFADGHGGVALGSEMSGGVRRVLACDNHFSSPNLTYALRLKTNARRGGFIEDVMLCDSVMDHVHGAAVHGTMLYEDGRNGDDLPHFRNITVENITAHGGDYGVFLEAFDEVPITGLVLRNLTIDGVDREMRSMNWAPDAVVENVTINGKRYPRPGKVRILGVPAAGAELRATAEQQGGTAALSYLWEGSPDGTGWREAGTGETLRVPPCHWVRVTACGAGDTRESSIPYRVLTKAEARDTMTARLLCRGLRCEIELPDFPITRYHLAQLLLPLMDTTKAPAVFRDETDRACGLAVANGFLKETLPGYFNPDAGVTRQEMATVAMQACGINYRNASSTMPVCRDVKEVPSNYGTNIARALYFGFMTLEDGCFHPKKEVSSAEACAILERVADFAGL